MIRWSDRLSITRMVVGSILMCAGALKGYQLATEPATSHSVLGSKWIVAIAAEGELLLGLLLVLGIASRAVTWFCTVGFAAFAAVSAYKGFLGETDCGCFGRVTMNPWLTFTIDIVCLTALATISWRTTAKLQYANRLRWSTIRVMGLAIVVGATAGLAMVGFLPDRLTEGGQIIGDLGPVVLEPREWIDKLFPLLKFIDVGKDLAQGEWVVILYHHDCPKCQKVIAKYELQPSQHLGEQPRNRIALVEVPPYRTIETAAIGDFRYGKLKDDREWFVATPCELRLVDGRVKAVSTND